MTKIFVTLIITLATICVSQAQILYKISGNGLEKPSYIFGTHHYAPLSIIDSVPSVKEALSQVNSVVGELDMINLNPAQMALQMQPLMLAPQDSTLSKLFSPEEFSEADSLFKSATNMHLELFETMRPIVPQTVLLAVNSAKLTNVDIQNDQLDKWFQTKGKEQGKEVKGLETIQQQAEILYTSTPLTVQAENLLDNLRNMDEGVETLRQLTAAYMSRDLEKLASLSSEQNTNDQDKAFMDALLKGRNTNWLSQMPDMMSNTPTIFVVGALHLPGDDGLLNGLKRLGYTIIPIE